MEQQVLMNLNMIDINFVVVKQPICALYTNMTKPFKLFPLQIYVHPKFDDPHNDVALIKLNKDVKINDFVRPNCLAHGESPVVSQNCWALGYASESGKQILVILVY